MKQLELFSDETAVRGLSPVAEDILLTLREYVKSLNIISGKNSNRADRENALISSSRFWSICENNQDALYELVFSSIVNDPVELDFLIYSGCNGLKKNRNKHWVKFLAKVRARQDELPERVQNSLRWRFENYGY